MGAFNRYRKRTIADWASFNVLTDVPSLKAWYRADTTTNAGGFVSQLTDKSGNGYHLTQGTGSKQPALIASGSDPNGRDCVVSDGVDDAMTIASPGYGAMNDCTVFDVTRSLVAPGVSAYWFAQGITTEAKVFGCFILGGTTRPAWRYYNPASTLSSRSVDTANAVYASSVPTINVGRHDSAASASTTPIVRSRLGQPVTTNSSSSSTVSTISAYGVGCFAARTGTSGYTAGGLYERIVCNALLTDDQCRKIELYLAGYYGLL